MDGYQFEEQCAIILKRKHFSKIEVTKSSGDQGVDIIAYKHRKKKNVKSLSMVQVPQALQSQSFCLHMVLKILPCVTNQVFFPLTLKVLTGCRKK